MDPTMKVMAPWTDEQVASLDAFQKSETSRPFKDEKGVTLVATSGGLMKQGTNERVQIWAYCWMLDWTWRAASKIVGPQNVAVDLQGCIFPVRDGQPTLLSMPQSPHPHLPCFTTKEKLLGLMERIGVPVDNIKAISNPMEFLDSMNEYKIVVILDPYFTSEGKVRYREIRVQGS